VDALLTPLGGVALLAGFGAAQWAVTGLWARGAPTKEAFLVARRRVGLWMAAFSIAAAWVWAPSMFVSAQQAFEHGLAGLFWFTAPNILCLLLFAPFARRVRERLPEGFTLSAWMGQRHGNVVHGLYLLQMGALTVAAFAVQLLAGGKVVAWLAGLPYAAVVVAMSVLALSYSLLSGLRASVVTDYVKLAFILVAGAVLAPWAATEAGGLDIVWTGLSGRDGRWGSLVSEEGIDLFLSFGLPATIGLLSGPFGDQAFWQRAFATERAHVLGAFVRAALLFAAVPLLCGTLGFVAAGAHLSIADPALVNVETVRALLPRAAAVLFGLVLLSGLVSTLDSKLCAISSLVGHDLLALRSPGAPLDDVRTLRWARLGMLGLALGGAGIALVPGMQIVWLFLTYGTLRSSTLLPTVFTVLCTRVSSRGVAWGIGAALTVGLPVFGYGNLTRQPIISAAGSLLTVLLSGTIALAWTWRERSAPRP